jgi:hypothetical protein
MASKSEPGDSLLKWPLVSEPRTCKGESGIRNPTIIITNKLVSGAREERRRVPREFTTTSRVIIISNDWKTLNMNVAALQDRGHVLMFEPSAAEVHHKAGTWFDDREIYEWFGADLHRVCEPSMRQYVRARELKAARMDWTDVFAVEAENRRERLAAELLVSDAYDSTGERVKAFGERGGGIERRFLTTSVIYFSR